MRLDAKMIVNDDAPGPRGEGLRGRLATAVTRDVHKQARPAREVATGAPPPYLDQWRPVQSTRETKFSKGFVGDCRGCRVIPYKSLEVPSPLSYWI